MTALQVALNPAETAGMVGRFFVVLGLMLAAGKLVAVLCDRFGQPPVLGELLAGLLLGASGLGLIPTVASDPLSPVVGRLAEVGVALLLFEVGLETQLRAMIRVGTQAVAVSVVGVVATFLLVLWYWASPLHASEAPSGDLRAGVFLAAALTATSVGITARVLRDLAHTDSLEARVVLGAAVIDDVLGLVILSAALGFVSGQTLGVGGLMQRFAIGIGYLLAALAVGVALAPRVFAAIDRMRARGTLVVASFAFLLLLAALAERAGSAPIVGAFAAGMILSGTAQADTIRTQMRPVADIFVPIFFLSVGAAVDIRVFNPWNSHGRAVLAAAVVLIVLAVVGKLLAGWAVPWERFNRWAVGIGMSPRGEVALVAANLGLGMGVLTQELFAAILGVVIATALVTPPLLAGAFARWGVVRDGSVSAELP